MRHATFLVLSLAFPLTACGSDDSGGGSPSPVDAGVEASIDGSNPPDADSDAAADGTATDAELDGDVQDAGPEDGGQDADAAISVATEQEPNDGTTLQEYNDLDVGVQMEGAIGSAGDSDVFRVEAPAGKVLRITLSIPATSALEGHLAVFDDGRGGEAPGEDYVKLAAGQDAVLELLSMDSGGYFVAVRDVRNVEGGGVGGPDFTYALAADALEPDGFEGAALSFPSQFDDTLDHPGELRLYPFDGTEGSDIVIDMKATGTMDGRLMIFSRTIGSWIARNDDRGINDSDPLIDAWLTESGEMFLVVENVDESAASLSYSIDASMP